MALAFFIKLKGALPLKGKRSPALQGRKLHSIIMSLDKACQERSTKDPGSKSAWRQGVIVWQRSAVRDQNGKDRLKVQGEGGWGIKKGEGRRGTLDTIKSATIRPDFSLLTF